MKILVVSDIHACASDRLDAPQRSYVNAGHGTSSSHTQQFYDFISKNEDLLPDIVVCPGDMGDQADPTGIRHTWEFLNKLANLSSKPLLLATAGNHDLDSRYKYNDYDAKGILQDLNPSFPVVSENYKLLSEEQVVHSALHFWADNFYVIIIDSVRFVVLNSAAFHGYNNSSKEDNKAEHEHGRISNLTIKRLREFIQKQDEKLLKTEGDKKIKININILICHHHLQKDGSIDDKDYSAMRGGHALLDMLSDTDIGKWLVIHGHRHRARLYQTGDVTGPFVLSSASFGATRQDDPQNPSPNQAHLIIIDVEKMEKIKFFPAGKIKTFSHVQGMGWSPEYASSGGLPPVTSFGFRGPLEELAEEINSQITGSTPIEWPVLIKLLPKLAYLHYRQLEELRKCLSKDYSIKMVFDENKTPISCGREP
ncbi:MAG: metallophosphoesterase [Alphaproteobacteria bacterium]|nr:metallophosphoesterase [Alphaproteobacteria bacterium]